MNPEEAKSCVAAGIAMGLVKMGQATEVVATPIPPANIEVTAESPDEMEMAQKSLIEWARNKVTEQQQDRDELVAAYDYAVKQKWANGALKRQSEKAVKRVTFYEKVLQALEAGYVIVPNFPVTAFAIRTDKTKPLKMLTTRWADSHTQIPQALPVGEGEYKNPFPAVWEKSIAPETNTTNEVKQYWSGAWKDLEFPVSMSKPTIMAAATRAMALKIFDDLAILPGHAPSEGTRPPKGDPIIVARIMDPTRSFLGYSNSAHWVTFMVAWHLNTREI